MKPRSAWVALLLVTACDCGGGLATSADAAADARADAPVDGGPDGAGDAATDPWAGGRSDAGQPPDATRDAPAPPPTCGVNADPPPPACTAVDTDGFGDCGVPLGAAFDGTGCVEVTGCPCDGGDCGLFDSVLDCALACVRNSHFDLCQQAVPGRYDDSERSPWGEHGCGYCTVYLCAEPSRVDTFRAYVEALFPSLSIDCQTGGYGCRDGNSCRVPVGNVDADEALRICAASLLPGAEGAYCFIGL